MAVRYFISWTTTSQALSKLEFAGFCNKYSAMLQPVFRMQSAIQDETFGRRFWNKLTSKRLEAKSQLYQPPYWAQLQARCFQQDQRGGS